MCVCVCVCLSVSVCRYSCVRSPKCVKLGRQERMNRVEGTNLCLFKRVLGNLLQSLFVFRCHPKSPKRAKKGGVRCLDVCVMCGCITSNTISHSQPSLSLSACVKYAGKNARTNALWQDNFNLKPVPNRVLCNPRLFDGVESLGRGLKPRKANITRRRRIRRRRT